MVKRLLPLGKNNTTFILQLLTTTALICFDAGASVAQSIIDPINRLTDQNGVDLSFPEGPVKIDDEFISIGGGDGRLSFRMTTNTYFPEYCCSLWDDFTNNNNHSGFVWSGIDDDSQQFAEVGFEGELEKFTGAGPSFTNTLATGSSLTYTNGFFNYVRSDGTRVKFDANHIAPDKRTGVPVEVISPNGSIKRIHYKYGSPNPASGGSSVRVQSVTNNFGYQLKFNYDGPQDGRISSVVAINNALEYCNPTADSCGSLSGLWPKIMVAKTTSAEYSVQYPGSIQGYGRDEDVIVTDDLSRMTTYRIRPMPNNSGQIIQQLRSITRPGHTGNDFLFDTTVRGFSAATQAFDLYDLSISNIKYRYSIAAGRTVRTDPLGNKVVVSYHPTQVRTILLTDELGRVSSYTTDTVGRVVRVTEPEGNYTAYVYDSRGNIKTTTRVAKPGSGIANIVTSASFDGFCLNVLICNKPISTTDAKGQVTNYTYDPTTGLVLTVTQPAAVVGGVRPQTRYEYAAKEAFLKNSSGTVAASGAPIKLPIKISRCQATASCSGSADEAITTTAYGLQTVGSPNNLNLVTIINTNGNNTLSATTALDYDGIGNNISVDGPLNGAADTTRVRYDRARQVVGRIEADPDGAGNRMSVAQRITYRADGLPTLAESGTVTDQSDAAWANFVPLQQAASTYDANARSFAR